MRRLLLLALLFTSGVVFARDDTVAWYNFNETGAVTSVELRWRNPTDWSATQTLAGSATSYTLTNTIPGEIEFQVRFCTTDITYDPSCSNWIGKPARVPSDITSVIITAP